MIPSEQEAFPRQRGAPAWLLCLLLFWIPVLCLCCTMGAFGSQLWQSCAASGSEAFPLLSPLPPPSKQHESEEGESHRRHKHKKNKRSKEEKETSEDGTQEGEEQDSKE